MSGLDDPNQTFADLATRRMNVSSALEPPAKRPRWVKWWVTGLFVAMLGGLIGWGVMLDGEPTLTVQALAWAFNGSAVAGIVAVVAGLWPWLKNTLQRLLTVIGAVVVFRLAFFPIMVNAGLVTAWVENIIAPSGPPPVIFPVFLPTIGLMFVGAMGIAVLVIIVPRWWSIALAVGPGVMAGLISFTATTDLHPLPDRSFWADPTPVTTPTMPVKNPYTPALNEPDVPLPRMAILSAAASTYDFVPHSPWSATIKGTLESLFLANPTGSTQDRVLEHYRAYIAAHPTLSAPPPSSPAVPRLVP